jgi:hypothetical protein
MQMQQPSGLLPYVSVCEAVLKVLNQTLLHATVALRRVWTSDWFTLYRT